MCTGNTILTYRCSRGFSELTVMVSEYLQAISKIQTFVPGSYIPGIIALL